MEPAASNQIINALVGSVILLLAQIGLQSISSTAEYGVAHNAGPRDEKIEPKGLFAGRSKRALANFLETYGAFVGLAVALIATGRADGSGVLGAWLWFWSRVVYVPAYVFAVSYVRSAIWIISVIGLLMMCFRLAT